MGMGREAFVLPFGSGGIGVCGVSLLGCSQSWQQAQGWGFLLSVGAFPFKASRDVEISGGN